MSSLVGVFENFFEAEERQHAERGANEHGRLVKLSGHACGVGGKIEMFVAAAGAPITVPMAPEV